MKKTYPVLVLGLLVLLAVSPGESPVAAQTIDGFGQFQAAKLSGDSHGTDTGRIFVGNPSDRPMFALVIYYDPEGDLITEMGAGGCEGLVLRPHGGLPVYTDFDSDNDSIEVVAVRSDPSDPLFGKFGDAPRLQQIGVYLQGGHKTRGMAVRPSNFHLPTGDNKDAVIDCACVEVAAHVQDNTLLEQLGIFCPNV